MLLYSLPGGCQVILIVIVIVIVFTPWRLSGNLNCYCIQPFSKCQVIFILFHCIHINWKSWLFDKCFIPPAFSVLLARVFHWSSTLVCRWMFKFFQQNIFFCKLSRFVHLTSLQCHKYFLEFYFVQVRAPDPPSWQT